MDFIQLAQFLTKLPEDIDHEKLFKCIAEIDMHQRKFSHVLGAHLAENTASAASSSPWVLFMDVQLVLYSSIDQIFTKPLEEFDS